MENYKVTIAVFVYNVETYLVECLTTACRQTYTNLEILVINDASTDSSGFIADYFANRDGRIRVIHKMENEGIAAGRNTAIQEMSGDCVYWLDGNDFLQDDAIELAVQKMEHNHADIVKTIVRQQEDSYNGVYTSDEFIHLLLPDNIKSHIIGCLFRKNLYHEITHTTNRILEDYETMPLLAEKAQKIIVIPRGAYQYRIIHNREFTYSEANSFFEYHQQTLATAERYSKYHEKYPEECKTVLKQFAYDSCMACLYADDGDNLLDIRRNMTLLERDVMLNKTISKYQKWLYRSIISNSDNVKFVKMLKKTRWKVHTLSN